MIYNMEEYSEFLDNILKKIRLCYTWQLVRCFTNTFKDMPDQFAIEILFALQRQGHVLLSEDGWAMTKSMYQNLSGDKFFEKLEVNKSFRIPAIDYEVRKSSFYDALIDCFTIAVDLLPESINFAKGDDPWSLIFDTQTPENIGTGKLFQITKIPKEIEIARIEYLKSLPKIEDDAARKVITRIAIIEDERHAWMVPHIGFTNIVKIDPKRARGYFVVEKREGDKVWGE